jgi:hypothetical protein
MLAGAKNCSLYPAFFAYVKNDDVKDAFALIVGWASSLNNFDCHPQIKGAVRDFRFYSEDGDQPFAFIVNRDSLLFYFRKPAVASGNYSFTELKKSFGSAHKNPRGEYTIKLNSLVDAQKLKRFLGLS